MKTLYALILVLLLVGAAAAREKKDEKPPTLTDSQKYATAKIDLDIATTLLQLQPFQIRLARLQRDRRALLDGYEKLVDPNWKLNEETLEFELAPDAAKAESTGRPPTIEEKCKDAGNRVACFKAEIAGECKNAVNYEACVAEVTSKHPYEPTAPAAPAPAKPSN